MGQAQGPVGGQVTMVEVNNERGYVCAVHWLAALCGALNGCMHTVNVQAFPLN